VRDTPHGKINGGFVPAHSRRSVPMQEQDNVGPRYDYL